ncbi:diguanylate cyclase [Altericroceibacterium indicum]|uniref:diguanylate cyclase n=1 Tax=Altericroceibacterium indicum TaxID=374177 RepID=UPI00136C21AA
MQTLRNIFWPVIIGLAYYALAFASFHLSRGETGIATVWPASGLFVAALLLANRQRQFWIIVAVMVSSTVGNIADRIPPMVALGFSCSNVAEAILVTWLVSHGGKAQFSLDDADAVKRFAVAAVLGALWSACLAMAILGYWNSRFFISWFTTVALGILIVTPVIMLFASAVTSKHRPLSLTDISRSVAYFALVGAVTGGVFLQSRFPLLFLPPALVLMVVYRLGTLGAAVSVTLITAIGSVATTTGFGPIHLIDASYDTQVLFLQFYILIILASTVPLAVVLAESKRMFSRIKRGIRLIEMAERTAHVGHWHLNLVTGELFWSDEVYKIHGRDQSYKPELDTAIDNYHPDDRAWIIQLVENAVNEGQPFDTDARIVRSDGEIRHVNTRGEVETDTVGGIIGLYGVFQDVTRRVEILRELDQERQRAQDEAERAKLLAETDQLTGIGNRRKSMAVIQAAIDEARAHNQSLSVAILDVDHFKRINDRLGHATGDEVLKQITNQCSMSVREKDFVGRLGGEEFVIVLPGASPEKSLAICERVRQAIEKFKWAPLPIANVTVSIGLASYSVQNGSLEELLNEADKALYIAKDSGRNQLISLVA